MPVPYPPDPRTIHDHISTQRPGRGDLVQQAEAAAGHMPLGIVGTRPCVQEGHEPTTQASTEHGVPGAMLGMGCAVSGDGADAQAHRGQCRALIGLHAADMWHEGPEGRCGGRYISWPGR